MRAQLGDRLPAFTDAEFALLREAKLDFYGMNYYTAQFARHRTTPASDTDHIGNVDELPENKAGEVVGELSGIRWLRSAPKAFRKHLVRIHNLYGKPIYITENGCPCPGEDRMTKEESVKDVFRQRYFSDHFDAIIGAREDGAMVDGYFAWSLMDNLGEFLQMTGFHFSVAVPPPLQLKSYSSMLTVLLEWSEGYGIRFGVTFTDYKTLERTPKESALMLRSMVEKRMKA
jgi:beta-glucosidase